MLKEIQETLVRNLVNIPGWRTDRKIIVIESDDWGSIRMPSRKAYKQLVEKGIRVDQSIYDQFDTLEQREDLELLFNVLKKYKDIRGNHPVFTFNTVMGNPAFDRIKEDQFEQYHHEDFETSYERYNGDNIFDVWHNAIEEKLIFPQFHAREHLNVSLWMEALQKKQRDTLVSFNHNFFGLKADTPSSHQQNYLSAYWAENEDDFNNKLKILKDGLERFKSKFGFPSESFVACNYIFPAEMEKPLSDYGIKYIQTQRGHTSPDIYNGNKKIRRHFTGQRNSFNQYCLVRNCNFEPTLNPNSASVNECLKEIETAFRWKKPAIISTHRINYAGGLATDNRDNNLKNLEKLFTQILRSWPQVEFATTTEMGKIMEDQI